MTDEASKRLLEDLIVRVNSVGVAVARIEERTRSQDQRGTPWAQEQISALYQRVAALESLQVQVTRLTKTVELLAETEQRRQGAVRVLTWIAGLGFGGGAAGIAALIHQLLGMQ